MTVAAWIKVDLFDTAYQAIVTKGDTALAAHPQQYDQYRSLRVHRALDDFRQQRHVDQRRQVAPRRRRLYRQPTAESTSTACSTIPSPRPASSPETRYNVEIARNAERRRPRVRRPHLRRPHLQRRPLRRPGLRNFTASSAIGSLPKPAAPRPPIPRPFATERHGQRRRQLVDALQRHGRLRFQR